MATVAPCRRAPKISQTLKSKATEWNMQVASPGPRGWIGIVFPTKLTTLRWLTRTPLGTPVDPEVNMVYAGSSGPGT